MSDQRHDERIAERDTERDLIARAVSGDQSAYTALYAAHHAPIMATLLRLTKHRENAEDLLQITFAAAFHALPRFRVDSRFRTWVHRIAINHFLMSIRRPNPTTHGTEPIEFNLDSGDTIIGYSAPDAAMEMVADRVTLDAYMDRLAPVQRRVVRMVIQGYEHHEIADELGRSVGHSKSTLSRAKERMRVMARMRIRVPVSYQ